jgi:primosomal protein N' (replication factor Y)
MIAKGLDFEDVTLVGVINADTTLKLPDFRSAERTFALVEQVAGRAGRAHLNGHVIVQTYWADSAAIVAAARHDRALFLRDELPKRKMLRYPPYVKMANILVWGKDELAVKQEANTIYNDIAAQAHRTGKTGWTVLPCTPCALSKLRNTYRWHIVVKADSADFAQVMGPYFHQRKPRPGVSAAVDVNPLSLA